MSNTMKIKSWRKGRTPDVGEGTNEKRAQRCRDSLQKCKRHNPSRPQRA